MAIDDVRKKSEHGFLRSASCDRTRAFSKFPAVPNRYITMEAYRFMLAEAWFHAAVKLVSDGVVICGNFQKRK